MLKLIEKEIVVPVIEPDLDSADKDDIQNLEIKDSEIDSVPAISDEDISSKAFCDINNSQITDIWDIIGTINSFMITLNEESFNNKADVIKLLDTVADDLTISVGMLQKVSELLNQTSANLVDDGVKKAETILDTNNSIENSIE